jgi:predicted Zn-ribbon and HTH transcriptional regulator
LFDLSGYGNTPLDIRSNDVHLVAGWSSKIFDVLTAVEEGKKVLSAAFHVGTPKQCPRCGYSGDNPVHTCNRTPKEVQEECKKTY